MRARLLKDGAAARSLHSREGRQPGLVVALVVSALGLVGEPVLGGDSLGQLELSGLITNLDEVSAVCLARVFADEVDLMRARLVEYVGGSHSHL